MTTICVFCGSKPGVDASHAAIATRIGTMLGERGIALVYGGGRVGLMGAVADAVLAANGRVIGVIPQMLFDREVAHSGLSELHVVRTMAERKELMGALSDAFLTLPGGIGTMDEMFEAWTWTLLGLQTKPTALLNHAGYYGQLLGFLDRCVTEGFLDAKSRASLWVDDDAARLIERLETATRAPA